MSARDRDFNCALYVRLSFDVAKIDIVTLMRREKFRHVAARRVHRLLPTQKFKRLPQIRDAVNVDLVHHRGFVRVRFRHKQGALAAFARFDRNRQNAFDRTHCAIERELSDKRKFRERFGVDLFRDRDHPQRDSPSSAHAANDIRYY